MKGQIILTEYSNGPKVAIMTEAITAYRDNEKGAMVCTKDGRAWHVDESFGYIRCELSSHSE